MGGNNSNAVTIQLFKLPEGWRLIYLTPLDLARDLPNMGPLHNCPAVSSLATISTPKPIHSLTPFLSPTVTLTPIPLGAFIVFFYPPLVMNYDPLIWEDKSNYGEWGLNLSTRTGVIIKNYLQALHFKECQIGVIGPSGYFPSPDEVVHVGNVRYQLTISEDEQFGVRVGHYIEDQSLTKYDYNRYGLPVLQILATPSGWNECKTMGETVLFTLHVP